MCDVSRRLRLSDAGCFVTKHYHYGGSMFAHLFDGVRRFRGFHGFGMILVLEHVGRGRCGKMMRMDDALGGALKRTFLLSLLILPPDASPAAGFFL